MIPKLSCFGNPEEFALVYFLLFQAPSKGTLNYRKKAKHLFGRLSLSFVQDHLLNLSTYWTAAIQVFNSIILNQGTSRIPVAVSFTFEFLEQMTQTSSDSLSTMSLGVTRVLNQMVDLSQQSRLTVSFVESLKKLGFDSDMADLISEIRHGIVHKSLPPKDDIIRVACYVFMMIKEQFWDKSLSANLPLIRMDRLEGFSQTLVMALPELNKSIFESLPGQVRQVSSSTKQSKLEKTNNNIEQKKLDVQLSKILTLSHPSEVDFLEAINKSKVGNKKRKGITFLLSFVANKKSEVTPEQIELTRKVFTENVGISEFKAYFQKTDFRNHLRVIAIMSAINHQFEVIWKLIQENYETTLARSTFFSEWMEDNNFRTSDFSIHTYSKMDEKYNTEEILKRILTKK